MTYPDVRRPDAINNTRVTDMAARTESTRRSQQSAASEIAGRARETMTQARDQVQELQERAGDALHAARARTGDAQATLADKLEGGAEAIRERVSTDGRGRARPVVRRVAGAGDAVAGGLERSAYWLRENDLTDLRELVRQQLREHPGRTALLALGLGILFGRASKRD
jgi:hypothetical protein